VSKRHETSFGQSLARVGLDSVRSNPVRPKYSILFEAGSTDKGNRDVVIDWVSNEETALTDLAGIPGIPRFIATAIDGSKGSVIEEFIDGFDLAELPSQARDNEEIHTIISKVLATYAAAAKRDYVYNNLAGSTILVDRKTRQPYLIDWYNHVPGVLIEDKDAVLRQSEGRLREWERYFLGN
jgi:RIO-like serine/threonine protein kinase